MRVHPVQAPVHSEGVKAISAWLLTCIQPKSHQLFRGTLLVRSYERLGTAARMRDFIVTLACSGGAWSSPVYLLVMQMKPLGIEVLALPGHPEIEVGAGGKPCHSDVSNHLAAPHPLPLLHVTGKT